MCGWYGEKKKLDDISCSHSAHFVLVGNHSIRKTCISNLAASKLLSDEEIRMFAGHKDISTTQQSYIFATEPLEDRVSAYEAAISGKMPDVNVFKGFKQFKNKKARKP